MPRTCLACSSPEREAIFLPIELGSYGLSIALYGSLNARSGAG